MQRLDQPAGGRRRLIGGVCTPNWGAAMLRSELHEFLRDSAEPGIAITASGQVDFLNPAAERIFRIPVAGAVAMACHEILRNKAGSEGTTCHANCPLLEKVLSGAPVQPFDLELETSPGIRHWFSISTHLVRLGRDRLCVHFLRDVDVCRRLRTATQALLAEVAALSGYQLQESPGSPVRAPSSSLTQQERAILGCLARGATTEAIAGDLNISSATVRNHVQHLLRKLDAHSRMEAVIRAMRERLL
ncbi:MAG: hypothetical protein HUU38_08285 [Anaerolineales bacterium]|nr:hypothetical protein [Anaerolineales bacterium]